MGSQVSHEDSSMTTDVEKNAASNDQKRPIVPPVARTLDWEKAARLHNHIIEIGFAGEPEKPTLRTWWDIYFGGHGIDFSSNIDTNQCTKEDQKLNHDPATAVELENRLPAELIQFLKHAYHVYPTCRTAHHTTRHLEMRFFYDIARLVAPQTLLFCLNAGPDHGLWEIPNRYILLYKCCDVDPFIMAIPEMRVVIKDEYKLGAVPDPEDENTEIGRWLTFETVLEYFVEMIEQGRIKSGPSSAQQVAGEYTDGPRGPWYIPADGRGIIKATLSAWDDLIGAIQERLPLDMEDSTPMRYTEAEISQCKSPDVFLNAFLREIRIPTMFKYVAPGLRVSLPSEITNQPFSSLSRDCFPPIGFDSVFADAKKYYPFLLLRTDATISHSRCSSNDNFLSNPDRFNHGHWPCMGEYQSGLYLSPNGSLLRPDEFRLLLPYQLESNMCVKYGSGEQLNDRELWDGLYQSGMWYEVLPRGWSTRLEKLFRQWTWMIKEGHWDVGKEGVQGGIEKYKEANSVNKWKLYVVKKTW